MSSSTDCDSSQTSAVARVLHFAVHESREALPPTLFFAAGFNLIVFSMNLVLAEDYIEFASFMLATRSAIVVGKHLLARFSWHRFAFIQIWVLVLFLIDCTAAESNALFGDGELARLLPPRNQ